MNEVLKNLWSQISAASGPVKVAFGACVAVVAMVTAVMVWRAQNPHFVVLQADLDSHAFNNAVKALAEAGIRYETSTGGEPYVVLVESSKKHEAIAAMHLSGEFLDSDRGISSGLDGSSSVFLGQSERHQRTQKRMWEEAEMQLERLNFVSKAKVTVSGAPTSTLAALRDDARRASVVVTMRGVAKPTPTETRALVGVVRGATGVADERITIVDQHSNVLFDGIENGGTDTFLAQEERFARERTESTQRYLDSIFGPGVTIVGVTGDWKQVREESVQETLTPAKKPRSSRTKSVEEPRWPRTIGGPAGVAANNEEDAELIAGALESKTSSTLEEEQLNSFGTTRTHSITQPHQLQRLSISLVMDSSKEAQLPAAVKLVKAFVGFDEKRGDMMESEATEIASLVRDAEGAPVIPAPEQAPEPTNPILGMALEFGLEFVAGIAFLIVLLKSLKSARTGGTTAKGGSGSGGAGGQASSGGAGGSKRSSSKDGRADAFEEDVDMEALARAHIEELLENEPEKVSALLSRWALAEDVYAEAGSR